MFNNISYLKASFPYILVYQCYFITFEIERLSWEISLYELLSDWLHRPRPYLSQVATACEADGLCTRP